MSSMPNVAQPSSAPWRARVLVFAELKRRLNAPVAELELPQGATVGDLRRALEVSHPSLAPLLPACRIAVNAEYMDDTHPLDPSSELALIPPVSGG
ncbi:molybdopterin converting factor, subunit 1 [Isosphaera pallida ATCC 43644]|uniref:Molybdopterin synthase sulfur carrier subunit n=1 Tax=Isosphaera pallida (strain ATCC 43644 / DSM 9630 / IS1B) TaxID=575540 RepID=E8QZ60_ISOPI|nr:molybdopterin converting factor subunit 1 [Isosphaera pallida]ADV63202.1 molybdopterin converting factor, subunit 1 [Isosphaera pallida ATCC 43644]